MQISILCVGKLRESYFADSVMEYKKRIGRYAKVDIFEVTDEKTPERASEADEYIIRKKEAERLIKYIKEGMYIIALEIKGKQYTSEQFSEEIDKLILNRNSHIAFIIGGSLGLHPSVLELANKRISFSKMTFPHQMMRMILLEQIYRAIKIMKKEPYHK